MSDDLIMKQDYANTARDAQGKIFAELECTRQLNRYVGEIFANPQKDLCGILISGYKGTGKTFVVENYLRKFDQTHPVLIARHYQQHEKIPYFGFKYCISDYLSKIYYQLNKKQFRHFSNRLKNHLGDAFPLLLDYIPELSLITGQASGLSQRSMLPIENQLYPLFKRLFEFLTEYSGKPVFFFTDDLQWIDASGINLLKYLLLNLAPEKLIWIGACRASQNNMGFLKQLDEELGFNRRRIENIFLKGFHAEEVRKFLESRLAGACHDDLVAVCYDLSGGNPSHLQVLIESLKGSEYLYFDNRVWTCDKQLVEIRYKGQNSEGLFREGMKKLSAAAREVLCVMACMGRFNRRTVADWLGSDAVLMQRILKEASDAGMLTITENDIHFSDLHIGEMIYNGLESSKRVDLHYKIARLFYSRGLEFLSATEIILMVANFNQAVDILKAEGKLQMAAELNYKAGKISQQENALEQARYFFKMSAELLKECPWDEVFEQVFQVHMERARVEYVLGEYDLSEIHLDYLLERIPDPVKRARIFELKITINNHLGRYLKVVRILKESLGELGLELPAEGQLVDQEVKKLTDLLSQAEAGRSTGHHVNLAVDARLAILKLLYVGGMGLHHSSDVLMRWAALQIILCSGTETISGVKAIGCVSYGRMLIISGDIEKGFGFGLKGLKINNDLDDVNLRCRVFGVYAFYIQPWKRSYAESYPFLEKATRAGKISGDLIGLYIIKTHRLNLHLISGLPLEQLPHLDFEESHRGRELTYYITDYQKTLLTFLVGKSAVFTMPRQEPSWLAAELTIREEKFYRNYVWGRYYFLFGHYELAALSAKEADGNRKLQEGSPLLPANLFIWFLSMTQNWINYPEETRKTLKGNLDSILSSFNLWQAQGPANFRPAWYLLMAESFRIGGDHRQAVDYYERSSESSGSNIYHFAITHELWARCLLGNGGEHDNACSHLVRSIRAFNEWGAVAKAKQLTRQYEAMLLQTEVSRENLDQAMDIETIQHELSGDLEVPSLIKKLMVLLLRISGSTHVVVELVKDTGDPILYNELSLLAGPDNRRNEKPSGTTVPVSLLLRALKLQNTIVVNDLKTEKGFPDLEEICDRGVKSLLILPVTINGHLSMVIYLENIFAENWYVPERVRWARITANQGAVIIENARTHERAVKLNQELRREMAEKERLSSVIEGQKDAHLKALVQIQDDERKRIAGDLHDSLGSLLSTVKLRFNGLLEDFEKRVPEKVSRFNDAIEMLDQSIGELRQISHNMLPVSLKRFGLKAALETFVGQINASRQLETRLQILGLNRRLPEEIEVAAYRICQELVQNVIKHAGASLMRIQVIDHIDSLNIIVEDDGSGMAGKNISTGFGFTTIQSKVNLYKGSFEIDSKPGKGVMVLVDLPLTNQ